MKYWVKYILMLVIVIILLIKLFLWITFLLGIAVGTFYRYLMYNKIMKY